MIKVRSQSVALIFVGLLALLPSVVLGQSRSSPGQEQEALTNESIIKYRRSERRYEQLEEQEVLTNESIIKMVNAGLKAEMITRKIEASRVDFGLSTDGLIALKKANVPDEVITAMQEKQSEAWAMSRWQRPYGTQPMPPPWRGWGRGCRCGGCRGGWR
jgi:hypothetical protein